MNYLVERRGVILVPALVVTQVILLGLLISLRTAPFIGSETDGVYYMIGARSLFTHAFVPATFGGGIGMPLAIAAVNLIVSDTFRSAQLVSALAGLVYLVCAIRIFTRIISPTVGVTTGALLLVSPILLVNSTSSLTDVLAACLPLAGVSLLLADFKLPRWLITLVGGFLFGAAYAVRPINVVFFPLALVVTLRGNARSKAKHLVMAALGLLVGTLPQLYVNQKYFGNPFYSDNWRNIAALVFDWDHVNKLSSFRQAIQLAGPNLLVIWIKRFVIDIPVALYRVAYLPLLFAVPGIFLMWTKAQPAHRSIVIAWAGCAFCYLFLVAGVWRIESRYFLPVLPLLLSAGVVMWQELTARWKPVFVAGLACALLMSAVVAIRDGREHFRSQSTEFKEAGLFLRDNAVGEDVILASQPSVFLYAHRSGVLLESIPRDIDTALSSRRIDWIVFDERRGYPDNPTLGWLLDPKSSLATDRGWQPVFVRESPRIVVWRVGRASVSAHF